MQQPSMTKGEAKVLLVDIRKLVEAHKKTSIELCRMVWETSETVVNVAGEVLFLWQLWGYKSWKKFVGLELGIHPNKAYACRKVWQVFYIDLVGCWDKENLLPFTKMKILAADKINARNVNNKLKRAAAKTCPQLVAEIYDVDELHCIAITCTTSEQKTINKAIEKAREAYGSDGKKMPRGQVIARMSREWSSIHDTIERTSKGKLRLVG